MASLLPLTGTVEHIFTHPTYMVNAGAIDRDSLCNVFYKIISKILTNRLRWIINKTLSLMQSTFVLTIKSAHL